MRTTSIKIGDTFGYWKVVSFSQKGKAECFCTGCNITYKQHKFDILKCNKSRSCGCKNNEIAVKTSIEKYGVSNPTQNAVVKAKKAATTKARYGVEHAMQNDNIKMKQRATMKQQYGFEFTTQVPELKEKMRNNNKQKYGVEHTLVPPTQKYFLSSGESVVDHCNQRSIPTTHAYKVFHEYGENVFLEYCTSYHTTISTLEFAFTDLLKDIFPNLQLFNRKPTKDIAYRADFKLEHGGKTLYVNVDGLYWHSETRQPDKNYHYKIRESFEQQSLRIMQFRDDEIKIQPQIVRSMILNYFGIVQKYSARKCTIEKITQAEAHGFFQENHLMGYSNGTCYGLRYEGLLVSAILVAKQDDSIKIVRFCSKLNTAVRGGFSKLLKYVERCYPSTTAIVSFCDMRYASGNSYRQNSFVLTSMTLGWQWTDYKHTFNRLSCRANMDDRGLSQKAHAEELDWYKIYDAGQAKYTRRI